MIIHVVNADELKNEQKNDHAILQVKKAIENGDSTALKPHETLEL